MRIRFALVVCRSLRIQRPSGRRQAGHRHPLRGRVVEAAASLGGMRSRDSSTPGVFGADPGGLVLRPVTDKGQVAQWL
jgi:hypothetical protein